MQINKEQFGSFVAERRKELNMTQKELANKLFISDKAISKWERGLSLPDINMLLPLSEVLNISITELIESNKKEISQSLDKEHFETLLRTAIKFNEETELNDHKNKSILYFIAIFVFTIETLLIINQITIRGWIESNYMMFAIFGLVFGAYFHLIAKNKLPTYYDENKIGFVSDGFFRVHIQGLSFNNSNWPKIIHVGQYWTLFVLMFSPILQFALLYFFNSNGNPIFITLMLSLLLIPFLYVAKKYE